MRVYKIVRGCACEISVIYMFIIDITYVYEIKLVDIKA